eukprot:CAMPEP_0184860802 /NCGR_PEP_ID=MMETSP0580-20130426/5607_1 /TAXON_ID=1118495 /ORGANISM="Dactyliosolen fragilissimus" /LENGTH=448 /DNA_ID=CAMNT_0027358035 /DNA_START=295 /DNA_END=1641 /DNA_ORIENTATION=-
MKTSGMAITALAAICLQNASAFAPAAFTRQSLVVSSPSPSVWVSTSPATKSNFISLNKKSQLNAVDPSMFHDVVHAFSSSLTLSADEVDAAVASASAASDAAAASSGNGWFGFLEGPIEFLLQVLHSTLSGVDGAWGLSIIAMTALIKVVTYPLTSQQMTSTTKMQALQPTIKDIQAKYASNPEVMNQKIAEVYQTNNINPLAGCIPSLLQIPVFIGLYRAVLTLAKDNKLDESFLWLPNLEGPTYGADPAHGIDWILKGWTNGAPSLGWDDTLCFLSIPLLLVLTQSISLQLTSPKDQEQPAFLKFLPLLIGYFSLSVPAALGVYWVANNVFTTALTLQIRSGIQTTAPVGPSSSTTTTASSSNVVDVQPTTFNPAPIREKPAGFGASSWDDDASFSTDEDGVRNITSKDAEIISKDVTSNDEDAAVVSSSKSKKRGGGKKKKKRKN